MIVFLIRASQILRSRDKSMKINRNKQIPNVAVYVPLYTTIFGISIWLLAFQKDGIYNWFLYLAMIVSVFAGAVQFALQSRQKAILS